MPDFFCAVPLGAWRMGEAGEVGILTDQFLTY